MGLMTLLAVSLIDVAISVHSLGRILNSPPSILFANASRALVSSILISLRIDVRRSSDTSASCNSASSICTAFSTRRSRVRLKRSRPSRSRVTIVPHHTRNIPPRIPLMNIPRATLMSNLSSAYEEATPMPKPAKKNPARTVVRGKGDSSR